VTIEDLNLADDIAPEDISVFLEETDENLSLLDETIVQLEKGENTSSLLKEIFRAAHTLKGSAGMLGYEKMTHLAHAMENVLDLLRNGALEVTAEVIDGLLASLDLLSVLRDDLESLTDSGVDISKTVDQLNETAEQASNGAHAKISDEPDAIVKLGPEESDKLASLVKAGNVAQLIDVTLEASTTWTAVRCFQILDLLAGDGEVLASLPTKEAIEEGNAGLSLSVIFAGAQDEAALKVAIAAVEDVETVEVMPYVMGESSDDILENDNPEGGASVPAERKTKAVRIDVERLDQLMNMVGELVIDRTRILQISNMLESRFGDDDMVQALAKTSGHIVKVVDELHETTLKVRMLPIGTVFSGFPRMIRDLARTTGKTVELVVAGQDTEIDRTVIERIRDPLVHLLRNAVDHGAEPPESRRAVGKPETATIQLSAYHAEGFIVIEIEDDGNGIDPSKLKDAAVSKGVISQEMADRLSGSELLDLIFTPGMSTAAKTTEVSGRGVGMDIVKANLEAIGGFVNIDTEVGKGTKFTLKLPLTLATVRALLVSSDNALFAVPVVHVLEAARLDASDIETVNQKEVFKLRDDIVPLLRLGDMVGSEAFKDARSDTTFVVVVRLGERLVGLGVDSLIELQEIVVKPLGQLVGEAKGVAGASVLGDGQVVLILDIPVLVSSVVYAAA
jgi:two-component system, chemotaxis family, sensor kinase CheA